MENVLEKPITDKKQIELDKAWEKLWELATNQMVFGEGTIDHDGFIELGKQEFSLSLKTKRVFVIRTRLSDNDEWSPPQYFKTAKQRDKVGSLNRIIGGIRTHSFEERKTVEEIESLWFN